MSQSLSTIHPDFDALVIQFQNVLAGKNAWKDLLPTATGQTFTEFVAAVGELDQYSIQRLFQEMFSETARIDSTVMGITKMLGVRLSRRTPASVPLDCYIPVADPSGFPINLTPNPGIKRLDSLSYPLSNAYTIPAYTQFSSSSGLLFNREAIIFDAGIEYGYQIDSATGLKLQNLALYEGTINTRNYRGTGADFFSIISTEENFVISDSDVVVTVNNIVVPRQTQGLWNNRNAAPGWQDMTTSRGQLHVLFGTKVTGGSLSAGFGTVPTSLDSIRLTYVTTKGAAGNSTFSNPSLNCTTYPGLIDTTYTSLTNGLVDGANQRSAVDYQKLGARIYAADQGERGVVEQDYNVLALNYPGIVDARLLGQRDTHPNRPSFMNTIKVITYPMFSGPSQAVANDDFIEFMTAKTMYSMRFWPTSTDVDYGAVLNNILVDVQARVFCNNLADLNDVRQNYILPAIKSILDEAVSTIGPVKEGANIGQISRNLYRSDLIDAIKNSHPSIDYVLLDTPSVDVIAQLMDLRPQLTLVPGNLGGTLLPSTTYRYWISMINALGETVALGPFPVTLGPGDNGVTITWTPPTQTYPGQYTGFFLYGRDLVAPGRLNGVALSTTTDTYTDLGAALATSGLPDSDTSGINIILLPGTTSLSPDNGWTVNVATKITMSYSLRT